MNLLKSFLLVLLFICSSAFAEDTVSPREQFSEGQSLDEIYQIVGELNVPPPTRDKFSKFKKGTSMLEIFQTVGIPSKHTGSGLYVLVYELANDEECIVGTADLKGTAIYVRCDP